MLDIRHCTEKSFKERLSHKDWHKILLDEADQVTYQGRQVSLQAIDLGYGVVEVSKSFYEFDSINLIKAERERQIQEEGYTVGHDAGYSKDDLVLAAVCYALPSRLRPADDPPNGWPFDNEEWKPTPDDRIRELVKAGALIVAEIDRELHSRLNSKNT